ncbi:flagellar biosynthetic protein FliO [Bradyrhizobium sp. CB1650]|uniref:flagellar biosynthetic protein FliO n=1 Tax=Bradyrhizobium sp. CB1650 TaxID=3039153 RepID=UPI0024351677|nr:flagellar biosynthetic protein FliO [Bradyrhizobium sp. CB1650]WGD55607.1 flagellar biosynthetic protein FliO [Bradyrhizobium sp. CB1650]
MQGSPITFIVAFIVVLALIGVAAWLVRRFASSRLGANTQRGRMPRLAVIDAAAVDGRRRLVLVRRDNVEHLLMIGGPTDIVVEPNIVRAAPSRDQLPQRSTAAEPPRLAPMMPDTGGWADETPRPELLDHPEPQMPEPPPRPVRPSFADEVRRPAPALAERRNDPLAGFAPEPIAPRPEREPRPEPVPPRVARSEPLMPRPPRQSEPAKVPPVRAERAAVPPPPIPQAPSVPPPAPVPSSAEQNLAEMAQRLEAALRRPAGETVAPPVAPEPPAPPPQRASRNEPPTPPAPPAKPAAEKTSFENLEDEMASLLGRPKPPS